MRMITHFIASVTRGTFNWAQWLENSILRHQVFLRILTGRIHPQIKISVYEKYEYGHFGGWYIKSTLYKTFLH